MEAVPRLPMLSFELKQSPENTEFGHKLRSYIRDYYHEDPETYSKEIHELEGLRASAIRVSKDVEGCALLKKYYCQLNFLLSRFPMQEDGVACATYFWIDIYTNIVYSTSSIRHEMACILYNIGALHSQLGSFDNRTTADGMKMSCTHFQCAAWCFQQMRETLGRPKGSDMSPDLMQFLNYICLAQAQECILEKSMMDNRKALIIAKVGAHVVEYYNLALAILNQNSSDAGSILDTVGSKQHKNWSKYINFKIAYHNCVALLYQGQAMEEQQKMGERLAFYQAAVEKLTEAAKLSKGLELSDVIGDALQFTQDVVEGKRKAAFNDNEYIYHEKVPEKDSLPPLKGASLVKGIPFSINDADVSGVDIFARLVPLRAHEASSMYSEEKAKLLRRVGTQVDEKDTELNAFMSSLQLDTLNVGSDGDQLPNDLIEACAALSAQPEAVKELVNAMDKLAETYHEVEAMLQDIDQILKDEEEKEKIWKETFGIDRPPSIVATELTREANKYRKAHLVAGESNQTLHKAMSLHVANLRTLCKPLDEIANELPQTVGAGAETEEDKESIKEVNNLVAKVREMSTQRAMLSAQLREAVLKDDITGQLVTSASEGGVLDVLFEKEISKHQPLVAVIEQNMAAQANILRALTDAYARFAPSRKAASSANRKRQGTIAALLASFNAREDLLAKANKGLEFYCRLETSVSKLFTRVKSVCKVQEEERQQQQRASMPAQPAMPNTGVTSVGNPKLKDYLQAMKQGGQPAAFNNAPQPSAAIPPSSNPYFSQTYNPINPGAPMPSATPPPVITPVNPAPGEAVQWPPTIRPNPVGSEETPTYCATPPAPSPEKHINNSTNPYQQDNQKFQQPSHPYTHQNHLNPGMLPKVNNDAQPTVSNPGTTPTYSYPTPVSHSYPYYPPAGYQQPPTSTPNKPPASNFYPQQNYYQPRPQYPANQPQNQQYPAKPLNNYPQQYYQSGYNYAVPSTNYPAPVSTPQPPAQQPQRAYPSPAPTVPVPQPSPVQQPQPYQGQIQTPAGQGYQQQVPQQPAAGNAAAYPAPASTPQPAQNYGQQQTATGHPYAYTYPYNQSPSAYPTQQGYQSQNQYSGNAAYNTSSPNNATHSQYTSAGKSNLHQTNTSETAVGGQTFANQYSVASSTAPTSQPASYYSSPYYGYQNQAPGTPTSAPIPAYTPNQQVPSQARMPDTAPHTTFSSSPKRNANSSNVDLLAGLDFNVNTPPLIPEAKTTQVSSNEPAKVAATTPTQPTPAELKPVAPKAAPSEQPAEPPKSASPALLPIQPAAVKEPAPSKDPYAEPEALAQFTQEVERLEKVVEGLNNKTLNGPTPLDLKWKELQELQEKDAHKRSISVARCYPMKNRFPDILPFDHSRVELPSTKDDYINASFIKNISARSCDYILTQSPLPSTYLDFWTMIWEQQTELIVCLLSDAELNGEIYWPTQRGEELAIGKLRISLNSVNVKPSWTERLISITHPETKISRVLVHLQFTVWPGSSFPDSPSAFLSFVAEGLSQHAQQRSPKHPVVVHCHSGVGRSGLFCLLSAAMNEIRSGNGLPDLLTVAAIMSHQRRGTLRDRQHLLFAYQAVLYHCQDLLMKRGILTTRSSFDAPLAPKTHVRHPSEDFLLGPGSLSQLQSGIEKMGLGAANIEWNVPQPETSATPISVEEPPKLEHTAAPPVSSLSELTSLVPDLSNLTPNKSGTKKGRISKEDFEKKPGSLAGSISPQEEADPLSKLDPLWSLK
ncbi:tyrosine-protein phosphatase non-receptor type 23 isoform X2 [Neocloeon triangulifer]|uniref:tyrosine-protein phosphatase non-receptor type 23 isoform X2 n=1 Tax=Neocloeon triangulifer TaxID=2078957 RepID=UPI00286F2A0D|nr:tyrosine-protein phosphatase non-receptor type 23 isoform X2 [Neocloeon triangulifer]